MRESKPPNLISLAIPRPENPGRTTWQRLQTIVTLQRDLNHRHLRELDFLGYSRPLMDFSSRGSLHECQQNVGAREQGEGLLVRVGDGFGEQASTKRSSSVERHHEVMHSSGCFCSRGFHCRCVWLRRLGGAEARSQGACSTESSGSSEPSSESSSGSS